MSDNAVTTLPVRAGISKIDENANALLEGLSSDTLFPAAFLAW